MIDMNKRIPEEIKRQADEIVSHFNKTVIRNPSRYYVTRYRGSYLHLDRNNYGRVGPICRLKYNGSLTNWDFAIFRYGREFYDPDEWLFSGAGHVDGTIEGAMRAGMEAYP